jgi:hypothetical protein
MDVPGICQVTRHLFCLARSPCPGFNTDCPSWTSPARPAGDKQEIYSTPNQRRQGISDSNTKSTPAKFRKVSSKVSILHIISLLVIDSRRLLYRDRGNKSLHISGIARPIREASGSLAAPSKLIRISWLAIFIGFGPVIATALWRYTFVRDPSFNI